MSKFVQSFLAHTWQSALWLAQPGTVAQSQQNVAICENWQQLPRTAEGFEGILWHQPQHFAGDRRQLCSELAQRLAPAGSLHLQTRIIPATKLRGRKAKSVRLGADYLNAFHRFLEPGTGAAVSQYTWQNWLAEAGLEVTNVATVDELTDLRLHPGHSAKDFIRLKVLLVHAPEVARQRLTPHLADDRIQFHVYKANFVCRLKQYE